MKNRVQISLATMVAILVHFYSPAAFADTSASEQTVVGEQIGDTDEELALAPPTPEELNKLSDQISSIDTAAVVRNLSGGKIINKKKSKNGTAMLVLECVEQNKNQDGCEKLQMFYQDDVNKKVLTAPIETKQLTAYFEAFKANIQDIATRKTEITEYGPIFPATSVCYLGSAALPASIIGLIVGAGVKGILSIAILGVSGPIGTAALIALVFWPVTFDLAMLPYRLTRRAIGYPYVYFHNKHIKKRYSHIREAMSTLADGGDKTATLNGREFDDLLRLLGTLPSPGLH